MDRRVRRSAVALRHSATALALALAATAFGDPVIVIGDQPGVMRIVAGVPDPPATPSPLPPDPIATETPLVTPRALAIGADGVLYIGDRRRVVAVTSTGRLRVLVNDDSCVGDQCLVRVEGLALTGDGRLIIADPGSNRIFELDLATNARRIIAGTGSFGTAPDGEPAATAALANPTGVAVGAGGRIFFSERGAQRIRSIEPDGTLATIAGSGILGNIGDDGPATSARLASPAGIALAGDVLYIADSGNNRIRAVSLVPGIIRAVAGLGTAAFAGDGGPALVAALSQPTDVAVSPDERTLYIADTRNHRIRAVDLVRGVIVSFAGTGDTEFTGDLLPAGETALDSPGAVAVSPHGLLFIADTGHGLVWRTPVR